MAAEAGQVLDYRTKQQDAEELRDLADALRGSSSHKQVLIPLKGNQAFVEGTLDLGQEHAIKLMLPTTEGGIPEMSPGMSREEAIKILEEKRKAILATRPKKSILKPTKHNGATRQEGTEASASSTETTMAPFFEIREEYTEDGTQTTGQRINVSKQLEYLENNNNLNFQHDNQSAGNDEGGYGETIPVAPDPTRNTVTDQEYQKIASRLDKLILMEESAQQKKEKIISSGWGKGFLNKAKKVQPKKSKPEASTDLQISDDAVLSLDRTVIESAQDKQGVDTPRALPPKQTKIKFQNNHDVKEIPRIGERSVKELSMARPPSRPIVDKKPAEKGTVSAAAAKVPPETKPFDESILSKNVMERPRKKKSRATSSEPKSKGTSKFAQERQEG